MIDLSEVAQYRSLKIPGAVFAALFAICGGLVLFSNGYSNSLAQSLALKSLRPHKAGQLAKVSNPLEVYDFSVEYSYPAYTGMAAKKVEGGDGSISALKGTVAALHAKLPVKIEKAWLQFLPGGKMDAELKGADLSARMVLIEPGQYRIEGTDKNGKLWIEPAFHQINSISDSVPEVSLTEPVADDQAVSLDQKLKLKFHARDDYGLDSFWLVFTSRTGKGAEKRVLLKQLEPGELEAEGEYEWVLSEHNLIPGEKVGFYIEARDNNNVTGPGAGRSKLKYFEVFSPLKRHQEILASEQEIFEALIAFLGRGLETALAREPAQKFWDSEAGLLKDFEGLKARLDAVKAEADRDEYSSQFIRDALAQSSARYARLIAERREYLQTRDQAATAAARDKLAPQLESDILFWDNQLKKQRMDYLLSLGEKLKQGEDQLRKLMEDYKRTGNPEMLKDIESRLEELKATYEEFLAEMGKMNQSQLDEFVNMDALEKKGGGDVMSKLEKFRQSVHDRDLGNAMDSADDFLNGLDDMLADLKKGSDDLGTSISSELMSQMEQAMDELGKLKAEQDNLIKQTDPINQAQLKSQESASAAQEKMEQGLQEELNKLEDGNNQLADLLNKMQYDPKKNPQGASDYYNLKNQLNSVIGQMNNQIEIAKHYMAEKNYGAAKAQMDLLKNALGSTKMLGNKVCNGSGGGSSNSGPWNARADNNAASATSIGKKLSELGAMQKRGLTPAEASALAKQSSAQGALRSRLAALQKQGGDMFSKLPVAPDEMPGHLNNANGKMGDAQGQLADKNPGQGLASEKEASYHLDQAMKAMDKFKQKIKQNSKGGGVAQMPGGGTRSSESTMGDKDGSKGNKTTDFDIPGPEANKDPVEQRKRILKAMRDGSPKEYEELIRDYYKRLVQ